jgi:hypothetical protein
VEVPLRDKDASLPSQLVKNGGKKFCDTDARCVCFLKIFEKTFKRLIVKICGWLYNKCYKPSSAL